MEKACYGVKNMPLNLQNTLKRNQERILAQNLNEESFLQAILDLIPKSITSTKKTGDWIIYQKNDWGNLYLTFAKHNELDENILTRIKPFL